MGTRDFNCSSMQMIYWVLLLGLVRDSLTSNRIDAVMEINLEHAGTSRFC
jgi:hypothetical protein